MKKVKVFCKCAMKNLFMPVKAIYSTFTAGIEMFEKKLIKSFPFIYICYQHHWMGN